MGQVSLPLLNKIGKYQYWDFSLPFFFSFKKKSNDILFLKQLFFFYILNLSSKLTILLKLLENKLFHKKIDENFFSIYEKNDKIIIYKTPFYFGSLKFFFYHNFLLMTIFFFLPWHKDKKTKKNINFIFFLNFDFIFFLKKKKTFFFFKKKRCFLKFFKMWWF